MFVDDILCIHHSPDDVRFTPFKTGSVSGPGIYIGTKLTLMQLQNGV